MEPTKLFYVRLTKDSYGGRYGTTFIMQGSDIFSHTQKYPKSEWYRGCYLYTKPQVEHFEKTGSVAGFQDLVTDQIWFDFDIKDDLEKARQVTLTLVERLKAQGIPESKINITFSGNKGFHATVFVDKLLTRPEVTKVCTTLAGDLPGFDTTMYDYNQLIRVPLSFNTKSGLYAIPMDTINLREVTIGDIKEIAASPDLEHLRSYYTRAIATIPPSLYFIPKEEPKVVSSSNSMEWDIKPKGLSNCRWALSNGLFKNGERSHALLCLAATYKNQGFPLEIVYRMLKGVAELQAGRTGDERFSDTELYNNIILQVYSPTWNNGMYSCKKEGNYLFDYCKSLGLKSCKHDKTIFQEPHTLSDVTDSFKHYVENIEKNTVKTGIKSIDDNLFISTGTSLSILGAASSGKTALALNILNNTSKAGIKSVFASLDMSRNRLYEKVMYNISGHDRETLYKIFKDGKEGPLLEKLKQEYGNVFFFNKSSPTVEDVRNYIVDCQEKSGERIKLVMLDYFERVTADMNDDTAASKQVAGQLQDLVNDLDIALITLVQPNKFSLSGGPDSPIYNYTAIKGSSFLYQSFRQILSIWRPFYNPKDFTNDRFMQMAILKNDLGELNEFAFRWQGKKGKIDELDQMGYTELEQLLIQKEQRRTNSSNDGWN